MVFPFSGYSILEKLPMAVEEMFHVPCAVPTLTFLRLSTEGFAKAIVPTLYNDPRDIYHKLRGNSALCDAKRAVVGPVLDAIGENPALKKAVFSGLEWLDIAGYGVFLLFTLKDGLHQSAQAIELTQCNNPGYGQRGQIYEWTVTDAAGWVPGTFYTAEPHNPDTPIAPTSIDVNPANGYYLAASCQWRDWVTHQLVPVQTRIIDVTTGQVLDEDLVKASQPSEFNAIMWNRGLNNTGYAHKYEMQARIPPDSLSTIVYADPGSTFSRGSGH